MGDKRFIIEEIDGGIKQIIDTEGSGSGDPYAEPACALSASDILKLLNGLHEWNEHHKNKLNAIWVTIKSSEGGHG